VVGGTDGLVSGEEVGGSDVGSSVGGGVDSSWSLEGRTVGSSVGVRDNSFIGPVVGGTDG